MRILFLSYWSLRDGLTQSTVLPHLRILAGFAHVEKIVLCTVERNRQERAISKGFSMEKVEFTPLHSQKLPWGFLTKVTDFLVFPSVIKKLCKKHNIDVIIARGTPAGALVINVAKSLNLPFVVESFEPHADYMLESGVWGKLDPRYLFQKKWEKEITQEAGFLLPVTTNFQELLISNGISSEKIDVIPCCVNTNYFSFNRGERENYRKQLGLNNQRIIGVYVGKFGGIYYDQEAIELFRMSKEFFGGEFFLLILSPDSPQEIQQKLHKAGFLDKDFVITYKPHKEINALLSVADFAFSPIKPAPSRKYCSPVKDGEYWANGLPVLITAGVGDDSEIIKKENAGAVIKDLSKGEIILALEKIEKIINEPGYRDRISRIASEYRNFSIAERVYNKIFHPSTYFWKKTPLD